MAAQHSPLLSGSTPCEAGAAPASSVTGGDTGAGAAFYSRLYMNLLTGSVLDRKTSHTVDILYISIKVKIFNCFNVNGRNKARFAGNFFKKLVFVCNILTCMNNYIWQFFMFTGVGFTA